MANELSAVIFDAEIKKVHPRQLFMRAYTQGALKCPKTGELLTIAIPTI